MAGGEFSELDLALIDALQTQPRAAWARIGSALGISGSTAARRWERLTRDGLAWLTAYTTFGITQIAYVEVRCDAADVPETARRLAGEGWVLSVDRVCGSHDLFIIVSAYDLPTLASSLSSEIGGLPGVTSVKTRLATHVYHEGSGWHSGSLDHRQREVLTGSAEIHDALAPTSVRKEDLPLLAAIGANGRASYIDIAAELGTTEHAARRRLRHLVDSGQVLFRCDFAYQLAGWPITAVYMAQVSSSELEETAQALSKVPEIRLCAAATGESNLVITTCLHSVADSHRLESKLSKRFPALGILDRTISMGSIKRMGRLLDEQGRATRFVPMTTRFPEGF